MSDADEDAAPSQSGANGHVDNHQSPDGHTNGFHAPHTPPLDSDRLDDSLLPHLLDAPTSYIQRILNPLDGWTDLDLNAPNVSPATGAVIQSPTVPPLDLHTRLQQEQGQLLIRLPYSNNVSIRDSATSPPDIHQNSSSNGNTNGSGSQVPVLRDYDGDIESLSP